LYGPPGYNLKERGGYANAPAQDQANDPTGLDPRIEIPPSPFVLADSVLLGRSLDRPFNLTIPVAGQLSPATGTE
jgi:hypothetical protein